MIVEQGRSHALSVPWEISSYSAVILKIFTRRIEGQRGQLFGAHVVQPFHCNGNEAQALSAPGATGLHDECLCCRGRYSRTADFCSIQQFGWEPMLHRFDLYDMRYVDSCLHLILLDELASVQDRTEQARVSMEIMSFGVCEI